MTNKTNNAKRPTVIFPQGEDGDAIALRCIEMISPLKKSPSGEWGFSIYVPTITRCWCGYVSFELATKARDKMISAWSDALR